jgi:hypothetical protein
MVLKIDAEVITELTSTRPPPYLPYTLKPKDLAVRKPWEL